LFNIRSSPQAHRSFSIERLSVMSSKFSAPDPCSFSARRALAALAAACAVAGLLRPAQALEISFNGLALVITDNGVLDLNPTVGIIDFNTIVGNYAVVGTLDQVAGPSVVSLIGGPTAALRLTNFIAEALTASPGQLDILFTDAVAGTFPGVTAADSLDAYVGHATGAAIPAGTDRIVAWQGFISGATIFPTAPSPPPYFNPALPASSPPLPYTFVTQGPVAYGPTVNPIFGAYLAIDLGGVGNQLILPSSAEVAFVAIPEAGSLALAGLAATAAAVPMALRLRARPLSRG
jgi:hypothetical protein